MKKKMAKTLAVLICLFTAVAFTPVLAFAIEPAEQEETEPVEMLVDDAGEMDAAEITAEENEEPEVVVAAEAAAPAKVSLTVNKKGVIAKTRSGKIAWNLDVTVTDRNKDGKLTVDEALFAAHKAYVYSSYYATKQTEYGTTVTKLWGVATQNTLFFVNGKGFYENVGNKEIKAGDALYASVNKDNTNYADWYTEFNKNKVETLAGKNVELTLTGFQGMAGGDSSAVKNVQIGTWNAGKFKAIDGLKTDEEGKLVFKPEKAGTYYLTARGTVADKSWGGEDIDAPIMAPMCVVTAKAADDVHVSVTVNNKGVIAKTKKGKIAYNLDVVVKDRNKDGKLTVDEALFAAHKAYVYSSYYATKQTQYGTTVTKLWGFKTQNTLFFVNGQSLYENVGEKTVADGDKIYASVNKDGKNYADWYTSFDKTSVNAAPFEKITLNLSGFQGMSGGKAKTVKNVRIGKWVKGKFVEFEGTTVDEEGNAVLSFSKAGTYYVTASGSVADKSWGGEDIEAPIMAPVCVITIAK